MLTAVHCTKTIINKKKQKKKQKLVLSVVKAKGSGSLKPRESDDFICREKEFNGGV